MLNYRLALDVEGIVSRQVAPEDERGWQRFKALDSLVAQRLQKQRQMPNHLLFASSDNERPSMAGIFEQCSLLNGISDLWNAIVKVPIDHACFVQIVDQAPGLSDPARMALEKSLLRVSPFPLDSFEELLEVQEQVYDTKIFSAVLLDRHGRLSYRDERDYFHKSEGKQRRSLFIDADIREGTDSPKRKSLHGLDVKVQDFRLGLHGTSELFQRWDQWLESNARNASRYQRIYVYSHLKGLLPACWEQLQKRNVAAEVVRLPQWIAYSNAIASFMEFLVADVDAAAYIFVGLNGKCHFAEWIR